MQMIDTRNRSAPQKNVHKFFWTCPLMMSTLFFLFSAFSSKASDELCFVSVQLKGTNLIYYVTEPRGGVTLEGVAKYLDKCVSYASTNLSVHIRVGSDVLFKHVANLTKICQDRKLTRVFFYWPEAGENGDEISHFAFLYVSVLDNVSAKRMSPFLFEENEITNPNKTISPP